MILEFAPRGEMYKTLQKQLGGRFDESRASKYIRQMTEALAYCHSKKVIHRDIKPENIMIDSSDRAVLIDFGTAREFIAGKTGDLTQLLTPGYAPFEQYSKNSKRYAASDI